ncbi:hypothetical protein SAZ10_07705 [Mesorhizobium sp. BAC0120]|uniref:hypothetical protein n=1 Tax=Mesorhizobium sp. BAC0120 TaxID=3090670 RepID=UPI00298CF0AE|nr:hypothetical protein [Mesorhizobium sp. BAC0120]MDW6021649.1 hypothetical protein [Mesorhizobium sp. BAC0120]
MPDTNINLRRLFRNRFEVYLATGDPTVSGEFDGSLLTLLELCEILKHDREPFPQYYDRDLAKVCGHEARTWFRKERRYSDVARLMAKHASLSMEGQLRRAGIWVATVLKSSENSIDPSGAAYRSGDDDDHEIELDYVVSQNEHGPSA